MNSTKSTTEIDRFIGERLCQFRAKQGLSMREIAEKIGVTHQQFQKYEIGKNRIAASTLVEISKILHVPFGGVFPDQKKIKKIPKEKIKKPPLNLIRIVDLKKSNQLKKPICLNNYLKKAKYEQAKKKAKEMIDVWEAHIAIEKSYSYTLKSLIGCLKRHFQDDLREWRRFVFYITKSNNLMCRIGIDWMLVDRNVWNVKKGLYHSLEEKSEWRDSRENFMKQIQEVQLWKTL